MDKAFTKNDAVTYIDNWDGKGTFYFTHAVVYSCGAKQMVLTDAVSGDEIGRHFAPKLGENSGTFPRMTDEEAIAQCIKAAEAWLPEEVARCERCIEFNTGPELKGYRDNIRESINKLHEARAHTNQGESNV